MGLQFISLGNLDEDGNDTGEGYTIDSDTGDVFDENAAPLNQIDATTNQLNEYDQWLDKDGNWLRNATEQELLQAAGEDQRVIGGGGGGTGPVGGARDDGVMGGRGTATDRMDYSGAGGSTKTMTGAGDTSWSLPKILDRVKEFTGLSGPQLAGLGLGALTLHDSLKRQPYNPKSPKELLASLPSNAPAAFSAEQMAQWAQPFKAGPQLTRQSAASMVSPIEPGQRFADGGMVEGALSQVFDSSAMQGLVSGAGGGQDDMVPARLSPGEYVFDAESVSMLGDGDNGAGARKLDELRANLRAHKRSAPEDEIAPPAQGALSYLGELND